MKKSINYWLIFGIVAVLLASGCTQTSTGSPTPEASEGHSPTSPSSSATTLPAGAPSVDKPVDTDELEKSPCSLLSRSQMLELGIPAAGKKSIEVEGAQCVWRDPNIPYGYRIDATFLKVDPNSPGISSFYEARDNYQDFEVLQPINGFPAVYANPSRNNRSTGDCALEMGLSDKQALDVGIQLDYKNANYTNACSVTMEVAKAFAQTARDQGGS